MQTDVKDGQQMLVDQGPAPARLPATRKGGKLPAVAQPTTPMELLRIVTERGATAEEVGKFMDLLERQQDRAAQQAFVRAIAEFKKDAPRITKDAGARFTAKGQDVAYDYATLGHICEHVIAALAEHGISHDWRIEQPDNGMIIVTCTLTHEQGGSKATTIQFPPDPSGSKNGLQAIGSAVTYGQRYTLLAVCGIAVKEQGDDDGRAAGGPLEGATSDTTTAQAGKHAIDGPTLRNALAAIKAHNYTVADLVSYYALTDAQKVLARSELKLTAEELP